ncbi:iron ABC transporter permease [Desulfuromonas sp. CSMB_57]|jgi:iron complex transport system permease protein|uniref:FecCD family ABC transporter permease n=1 Tax=Desulfuromonas sp. CSMB_57 TaxID=2807629 RepID=UPI001CD6F1DD|nr:iron ABC transporter permease [Desulfuromonas sp. CSMB_57]
MASKRGTRRITPRAGVFLLLTLGVLLSGMFLSISFGPWQIGLTDIGRIVVTRIFGQPGETDPAALAIIWYGRIPRTLTGALVGFALGVAGTVMQGIFKNPMAEPGIIGTSAGAALGAVTAIYLGFAAGSVHAVPLFAILFAFLSMLIVLGIATSGGLTSRYTLLLGGIALNAIFNALTAVVIVLSTDQFEMARQIIGWLMGDLTNRSWDHVQIILAIALFGTLASMLYARDLNIIMLNEEVAANLGVNVARSRNMLLFFASMLTGGAIAVAGAIGFVGLIAPHVMRSFVGPDNRLLIPAAGLLGGALVVYSDCAVRLWSEGGLRIGVLTALLGGPFFLYLIIRDRRKFVFF